MKKKIILIIILVLIIACIIALIININNKSRFENVNKLDEDIKDKLEETDKIVEFNEKLFLAQMDDVYVNMEKYEGKVIQYEGFIYNIPDDENYVIGRENYCCGTDSYLVGLEVISDKKFENDTWVKITGKVVLSNKYEHITPMLEVVDVQLTDPKERFVSY